MPRQSDVFTAAQAAQILGISERRVRQLVTEGKLPGKRGDDNIVRIPQQAVNEERKRRRGTASKASASTAKRASRRSRAEAPAAADNVDVDAIAEKVASVVGQRLEGRLEVTQRAESFLRAELDEERASRAHAEAQLNAARNELADVQARLDEARQRVQALEAQAQQRRGLFRR